MKTIKQIKQIVKVLTLTVALAFTFSCDNKKSTKSTTTTSGYSFTSNGACVQNSTGTIVATTYCTTTTGYSYVNGYCVQTSTGQAVPTNYCSTSTGGSTQCVGTYWFWNNYNWQSITCAGSNCSGYTLYPSGATSQAQAIYCQ